MWVTLGEILDVKGGKRIPVGTKLLKNNTGYKYIRVADMKDGSIIDTDIHYISEEIHNQIKQYKISKNDIYITCAGTIGKVGLVPDKFDNANLTENANKLVFNHLYKKWLYYFLSSDFIQNQVKDATTKVGQPKLAIKRINELFIPLVPLSEQHRIVQKIEELLPLVEQYDKTEQKLTALNTNFPEQLKKSVLQAAIQGKLTEQNPNDEPAFALIERIKAEKNRLIAEKKLKKPKSVAEIVMRDNLPYEIKDGVERCIADEVPFEIPENWCWVRLGEIGLVQTGTTPPKSNIENYSNNDFPFFKPNDLAQRKNIHLATEFLSLKGKEKARIATKNSILINGIGNIGQLGILRVDGAFNQQMHSLSPYGNLNVNTIYYFLQSEILQLSMKTSSSQTTIPIMNKSSFENILIPIPSISEQHRIVQKIEQLFTEVEKL